MTFHGSRAIENQAKSMDTNRGKIKIYQNRKVHKNKMNLPWRGEQIAGTALR